jgi:elongation factor Ts
MWQAARNDRRRLDGLQKSPGRGQGRNIDAAVDLLRKRGSASAAKKASRETKEGVIAQCILPGAKTGVWPRSIARPISSRATNLPRLLRRHRPQAGVRRDAGIAGRRTGSPPWRASGENIQIPRFVRYEVAGNGMWRPTFTPAPRWACWWKWAPARRRPWRGGIQAIGARHHVANRGRQPVGHFARASPAATVAKEKEIAAEQVKNKPPQAIAKIVEGKLEKFYQGVCLLDQGFVKRNSEVSVKEHIGGIAKQLGRRDRHPAALPLPGGRNSGGVFNILSFSLASVEQSYHSASIDFCPRILFRIMGRKPRRTSVKTDSYDFQDYSAPYS